MEAGRIRPSWTDPDAFETFMGRWSEHLARPFLSFADIAPGGNVLDVACGTGESAGRGGRARDRYRCVGEIPRGSPPPSTMCAALAWSDTGHLLWLFGAAILIANWPHTLLGIMPTKRKLMGIDTIPEAERDKELPEKLKSEWPAILGWMMQRCLIWQRGGLAPPGAVRAATDEYLEAEDSLAAWLGECCQSGGTSHWNCPPPLNDTTSTSREGGGEGRPESSSLPLPGSLADQPLEPTPRAGSDPGSRR